MKLLTNSWPPDHLRSTYPVLIASDDSHQHTSQSLTY